MVVDCAVVGGDRAAVIKLRKGSIADPRLAEGVVGHWGVRVLDGEVQRAHDGNGRTKAIGGQAGERKQASRQKASKYTCKQLPVPGDVDGVARVAGKGLVDQLVQGGLDLLVRLVKPCMQAGIN